MAVALASGAVISISYADKVSMDQLPLDVKDKIRLQTGGERVEDIDRQTKGGQTIYEVAFKKNGQNTELTFNDRGELLNPEQESSPKSKKISYNELPAVVKKIADARLKGAEVNDVDRQVKDGQTTYELGFKQGGEQQELVIAQDGRILADGAIPTAAGAAAVAASGTGASSAMTSLPEPVMLANQSKVSLNETPAAVQKSVAAAAHGARIEDIDRGTWQGRSVYQAAFKENGRNIELQVRDDGTILYDPRKTGTSSAANRGIRWGNTNPLYRDLKTPVILSDARKVEEASLPAIVQRTLKTHGGMRVDDVERGTWHGKTIYEAGFKDRSGQHVELQIDEKGNIVFDPRTHK